MYCPNCGQENPNEARFCRKCGQPIRKYQQNPSGVSRDKDYTGGKTKQRKSYQWVVVLLSIILCAALLAVLVLQFHLLDRFIPSDTNVDDQTAGESTVITDTSETQDSIARAEEFVLNGDYVSAIQLLQRALAEDGADERLEAKLQELQDEYAAEILRQAEEALEKEDYDLTLALLSQALELLPEQEMLTAKLSEVEALAQNKEEPEAEDPPRKEEPEQKNTEQNQETQNAAEIYTAANAKFVTYTGTIVQEEQDDRYQLTPEISGVYRLDLSNMVNGFAIRLYVFDDAGNTVDHVWYAESGSGLTVSLEAGKTYTVSAQEAEGAGDYTLTIGMQKETVDISAVDVVEDATEYTDQQNLYTFLPQNSGVYRFDLSEIQNGVEVRLYVYDSLGYTVDHRWSIGNDGLSVTLNANEVYTILVEQSVQTGRYLMRIGRQQACVNLSGGQTAKDAITFQDQVNNYTYTPQKSGEYVIGLGGLKNEFEVRVEVKDSLGYDVSYDSETVDDSKMMTISLEEGEAYSIAVKYRSNLGTYQIAIHES